MKGNKEYRFEDNPKEKEFYEKFIEMISNEGSDAIHSIIFSHDKYGKPKEYLTDRERDICSNLIQWLGSPVGQGFLEECGFTNKEVKK